MAKVVYGLGDPVLDIVARVDDALLQRLEAEPGGCLPVAADEMARLLALPELQANMMRVPGGSAANVMKGLAGLAQGSLAVSFVGMVGADAGGVEYRSSIAAHGVQPLLLESSSGATTATCLCLVTPDGQRTMRTSLCAALEMNTPQQLPPQLTQRGAAAGSGGGGSGGGAGGNSSSSGGGDCASCTAAAQQQQAANGSGGGDGSDGGGSGGGGMALLHCEGYCLYRPPVAAAAMRAAHAGGARVSLDLASFEVVQNCWAQLDSLLQGQVVDVLFCNEQEAQALCQAAELRLPATAGGCPAEQMIAAAQDYLLTQRGVRTVVVSRGKKGCTAKSVDGTWALATASDVHVVDTVGAGDCFTSGFLYALLDGASLQACASCGCAAGTAAVTTAGAELSPPALQQLRTHIAEVLAADRAAVTAAAAAALAAAAAGAADGVLL